MLPAISAATKWVYDAGLETNVALEDFTGDQVQGS